MRPGSFSSSRQGLDDACEFHATGLSIPLVRAFASAARSTASIHVHVRCSFALILTITILLSLHVAGGKLFGMWYCLAMHMHGSCGEL